MVIVVVGLVTRVVGLVDLVVALSLVIVVVGGGYLAPAE